MQKKCILLSAAIILITTVTVGTVFAMGAVKIDKAKDESQTDTEKRLELLEFALISQSPDKVADTWAKGVMTRNAALQYAVLCNNLQTKYRLDFEASEWSTGVSSPWIEHYQISPGERQNDGTWKFAIKFHYTDSTKATYSSDSNILIGPKDMSNDSSSERDTEHWCVIRIENFECIADVY